MPKPNYRDLSDETLISLIAKQDKAALEELARRYKHRVLGLCRYYGRRDSEDLFQETMLKVWQRAYQFSGISARAWVFTIARNLCLSEAQIERRHNRLAPTVPLENAVASLRAASDRTQSETLYDEELAQIIEKCLRGLGALSEIVRLRCFDELTVEEIAGLMSLSVSTTKHRLYDHALKQLRDCLERHLPDEVLKLKGKATPKKYRRDKRTKGEQS